jgi:hypothetical protein
MKYHSGTILLTIACVLSLAGGRACAQVGGMPRAGIGQSNIPPYSPYNSLLRNNAPLYQNYYDLVRPQFEFRSDVLGLQQQISANDQAIGGLQGNAGILATGHATGFLNTGGYFLNGGGRGAGGGGARQMMSQPQSPLGSAQPQSQLQSAPPGALR